MTIIVFQILSSFCLRILKMKEPCTVDFDNSLFSSLFAQCFFAVLLGFYQTSVRSPAETDEKRKEIGRDGKRLCERDKDGEG